MKRKMGRKQAKSALVARLRLFPMQITIKILSFGLTKMSDLFVAKA